MRVHIAIAVVIVAAAAALGVALLRPDAAPAGPEVRGCQDRVEGRKIVPNPRVDTVIGPIAFIALPGTYRDYASRRDSELVGYPPVNMPSMKTIGVLRAGARVKLVVPRAQRKWLKLVYDYPRFRGTHVARLQACRRFDTTAAQRRECGWRPLLACRWRYTQFNGGFGVDFVNAPERGLCAEVVVRVKGRAEPLRRFLFNPPPDACK